MGKVEDYSRRYVSVRRWLNGLSPRWHENHVSSMDRWVRWLRAQGLDWTPDSMVDYQFKAMGQNRFILLDLLQQWVQGLDTRRQTKLVYYNYLRAFFTHNRCELPRDRGFRVQSTKEKVTGTLTVDEIRRIVASSNEMYQAAILCMFSGLMGTGELIHFSDYGLVSLRQQLEEGRRVVKVDLPGRKKGRGIRPFYTFISGDAVRSLRLWMDKRPGDSEAVFVDQFGNPLRDHSLRFYWRRHLLRLGIIQQDGLSVSSTRTGKNLHEMRDVARSRWEKSDAKPSACEFFMGHVVDINQYNKAFQDVDFALTEYLKAEPWLNIVSNDPDKVPRVEMDRRLNELRLIQDEKFEEVKKEMEAIRKRLESTG